MKIAFDVDGVVLKSIDMILWRLREATGKMIYPSDLVTWDLDPLGINQELLSEAVYNMYSMERIDSYEGAVQTLEKIYEITREPLLFITGRTDLESAKRQLEALPWNPGAPELIVTGGSRDKRVYLRETGADFIIEDDELHLLDYLSEGVGVGLMTQPWNSRSEIPVTERFNGWSDVEKWITRNFE